MHDFFSKIISKTLVERARNKKGFKREKKVLQINIFFLEKKYGKKIGKLTCFLSTAEKMINKFNKIE